MIVLKTLYTIVLGPLELLFDVVFAIAYRILQNPGLALIFLSLAINFLVLPLYRRADAMQEEERIQAQKLKPGIDHIRKTFKGDERFMILQTYYRQNNYKPYYALKGSISLLLEIPFFIAAYRYLLGLSILQGASFGPIDNLGAPDHLLTIGSFSIHLLPILMTVINIISGIIYTRGMPLRSKIQLYGMAAIFLILLYESPSGLVFYWTLNNLFSLIKNIFYKLPNPKKVINILCSIGGIALILLAFLILRDLALRNKLLLLAAAIVLQLPLLLDYLKRKHPLREEKEETRTTRTIFYSCCVFMTILVGGVIPSAIINASPAEFVELSDYHSPLLYVLRAAFLSIGVFLIWCVIFYRLASLKTRRKISLLAVIIAAGAVINYMFFGKGYGNLSPLLKYDAPLDISASLYLLNGLILLAGAGIIYLIWRIKQGEIVKILCIAGCLAMAVMTVINVVGISTEAVSLEKQSLQYSTDTPEFTLDKNGQNVIVIMLDRAISAFLPYLFSENPKLEEQFAGFTYYPNAFSFGAFTNVGTPVIYGGYEYTPYEMNARADESLKDKQNEALKVMPVIFNDNNYRVTVCDPPYANYEWFPDLSIFDEYEGIQAYNTDGAFDFDEEERIEQKDKTIKRNLFCYSLFRVAPLILQKDVYTGGNYNEAEALKGNEEEILNYYSLDEYRSIGMRSDFLSAYRALENLAYMTRISDSGENTFLSLSNTATHNIMLLQEPGFVPVNYVDNSEYEMEHKVRSAMLNDKDMELTTLNQMEHYQCNMAALIQLGKWFDYLRENGVWDNTRIIIVSDHAVDLELYHLIMDGVEESVDLEIYEDPMSFNPLFLIKDFNSKEFTVDNTFMTCSDVPSEAFKDLIEDPVNPSTGKAINEDMKYEDELYAMYTNWNLYENNGNTFSDPMRITLKNRYMFDFDNWVVGDE